jgi:[ribosomal protein S5]-alanine N-acetyltransferase
METDNTKRWLIFILLTGGRKMLREVTILSERLKQVPISMDYAEDIFKSFNKDITTYMYPKQAGSIDETIDFINSSNEALEEGSNLQLVVLNKDTNKFLGCSGLHNINDKDPELGIWIKKEAHNNGYGIEAIGAIIEWAKRNIDFEYLKYPVDKRNYASRRIPESFNGIAKKEYKAINLSNDELDIVEYRIYK